VLACSPPCQDVVGCVALFGSTPLAAAAAWILGRRRQTGAPQSGLARAAGWLAGGTAALHLFLGGLVAALGDPAPMTGDISRLRVLLVLPLFGGP